MGVSHRHLGGVEGRLGCILVVVVTGRTAGLGCSRCTRLDFDNRLAVVEVGILLGRSLGSAVVYRSLPAAAAEAEACCKRRRRSFVAVGDSSFAPLGLARRVYEGRRWVSLMGKSKGSSM